jgi:hypothetical protein
VKTGPAQSSEAHDQLRSWYLALLRKDALGANAYTPASLIEADRKQVEELILDGTNSGAAQELPPPRVTTREPTGVVIATVGSFLLTLLNAITLLSAQPTELMFVLITSTSLSLLCLLSLLLSYRPIKNSVALAHVLSALHTYFRRNPHLTFKTCGTLLSNCWKS